MTPETIRAGRLARGWTQQQLAQHVGCSLTSVCGWESGRKRPTGLYARALCSALRVTP